MIEVEYPQFVVPADHLSVVLLLQPIDERTEVTFDGPGVHEGTPGQSLHGFGPRFTHAHLQHRSGQLEKQGVKTIELINLFHQATIQSKLLVGKQARTQGGGGVQTPPFPLFWSGN